jgi:hypothetical protein
LVCSPWSSSASLRSRLKSTSPITTKCDETSPIATV